MLLAHTIITRSPAAVTSFLSRLPSSYSSHPFLFSLSSNAPDLVNLVNVLTTFSSHSVGCLSAPLPGCDVDGRMTCSLAVFDKSAATLFRSDIPGRAAPQVGRWHAFRKQGEDTSMGEGPAEGTDWEDVWAKNAGHTGVPAELKGCSPADIRTIIYLSDNAPEGLSSSLRAFPRASTLGLVASSTPFVTGHPFTMFHNLQIYSSGAVGIALTSPKPARNLLVPGLRPISPSYTVTRSEGNLVQELNNTNPSRLLVEAIQKAKDPQPNKDDDFYLGTLDPSGTKPVQVYHITSGDPSRGTMALESGAAPAQGAVVQLYHRPKATPITPSGLSRSQRGQVPGSEEIAAAAAARRALTFFTSSADVFPDTAAMPAGASDDVVRWIPGSFVAASENGFLISNGGDDPAWTCTVAGSEVELDFSRPPL